MKKGRAGYASNFWDHVDKSNGPDACWPWLRYTGTAGYGALYYLGKSTSAHRVAYILAKGKPSGRVIRHSCDNPPCCNPSHLIAGSHKDNTRDMMAKGRARFGNVVRLGSAHHKAKLTEDDIPVIRNLISKGVPLTEIAKRFKVGAPNITWIKRGLTWRHVK